MDDEIFITRKISEEWLHLANQQIINKDPPEMQHYGKSNSFVSETEMQLHSACIQQNFDAVRSLLDQGALVNALNDQLATPLHLACAFDLGIVQCLVEHGANVNKWTRKFLSPLHVACYNNKIEIAKFLIQSGALLNRNTFPDIDEQKVSPLHLSCIAGSKECVNFLLEAGCQPDLLDESGATALHYSCQLIRPGIIQQLLSAGADCNAKDSHMFSPLVYALQHDCICDTAVNYAFHWHDRCDKKFIKTLRVLLENGANINSDRCSYTTEFYNSDNCKGYSSGGLHYQTEDEYSDTGEDCDDTGSSDVCCKWNFYLYLAIENGHFAALQCFLKAGMHHLCEMDEWYKDYIVDDIPFELDNVRMIVVWCKLCFSAGYEILKFILKSYYDQCLEIINGSGLIPESFRTEVSRLAEEAAQQLEKASNPCSLMLLSRSVIRKQLLEVANIGNIFPLVNSLELPLTLRDYLKLGEMDHFL